MANWAMIHSPTVQLPASGPLTPEPEAEAEAEAGAKQEASSAVAKNQANILEVSNTKTYLWSQLLLT